MPWLFDAVLHFSHMLNLLDCLCEMFWSLLKSIKSKYRKIMRLSCSWSIYERYGVFAEGFMGFRLSVRFDPGLFWQSLRLPSLQTRAWISITVSNTNFLCERPQRVTRHRSLFICLSEYFFTAHDPSLLNRARLKPAKTRLKNSTTNQTLLTHILEYKLQFYHPNRQTHLSGIHVVQHDDRRAVIVQNQPPEILHRVRQRMLGNDERGRLLVALIDGQTERETQQRSEHYEGRSSV